MKHSNNFILYTLGSASLLIMSAMLISVPSEFSDSAFLASVRKVEVSAVVRELPKEDREFFSSASLSGRVFQDTNNSGVFDGEDIPRVGTRVVLRSNETSPIFVSEVLTDETGSYYFNQLALGDYGVHLAEQSELGVSLPPSALSVFSFGLHRHSVSLDTAGLIYRDFDFIIEPTKATNETLIDSSI